mgnify:CR=1 FL=1
MKVKEFIEAMSKLPEDMEVIISDGMDFNFYHTNGISFTIWEGKAEIAIGGCKEGEIQYD